ncbi:hypothetical protein ABZZ47_31675 [Streptomyces sp. NPDC006465]|uniref:hypothetical protein n=1 Tax=Streptomyces sp. NPDC006465 TaxID=3157174 RepID=UPI0033A4E225
MGYGITRAKLLPRWTGRTAYVLAGANLVFVPSLAISSGASSAVKRPGMTCW